MKLQFHNTGRVTLDEVLRLRAVESPERTAYVYLHDGQTETGSVTYHELDERARCIAASLQSKYQAGHRALLLYTNALDFLAAFLGCLYAEVVAVPSQPPSRKRPLPRIQAIVRDAMPVVILTSTEILRNLEDQARQLPELHRVSWETTDTIPGNFSHDWRESKKTPDTLAFLQYTSGSTAAPKGVMVTHDNLMQNLSYLQFLGKMNAESASGTWLPPFHDMGLIEGILSPLYSGYPCYIMPPVAFLQRPHRWLELITRYGVTNSGGPNSAFELCIKRITDEQKQSLDLSSWCNCYNGSEPLRSETIIQFYESFRSCGLRWDSLRPAYGLAEATLVVSSNRKTDELKMLYADSGALEKGNIVEKTEAGAETRTIVSSGQIHEEYYDVAIVNPVSHVRCKAGEVGEIWLKGPCVTMGYWNRAAETQAAFENHIAGSGEGPYLRTGDLGFMKDRVVFVTGRIKDLIIIAGRNHYPQDIELTARASHPALQTVGGAAFSIDENGSERLVIIHEVDRQFLRTLNEEEVTGAMRQAISEEHEIRLSEVHFLKPGTLPRTSSGKVQRQLCKQLLLSGQIQSLGLETARFSPPGIVPEEGAQV